ncbi:putative isomerase YbhE [Thozetella sp. PMI_491]|nr:putative isomerase YbhE [Thozetella sp. PMI_491]
MKSSSLAALALLGQIQNAASSPLILAGGSGAGIHTLRVAHQEKGILTLTFDPNASPETSLQVIDTTPAGARPGWLSTHGNLLCSISRTNFPDNSSTSGGIFIFKKTDGSSASPGGLVPLSSTSSNGLGGVYCEISNNGQFLAAANIDGSTVSIHPLSNDGIVGEPTYVFKYNLTTPGPGEGDSQIQANPHQSIFDPSGQFIVVPDRGADLLYVYRARGARDVEKIQEITLEPGTGPRHVEFAQYGNETFMYLVSEIDNTIRVFTFDIHGGTCKGGQVATPDITLLQRASTLGPGSNRTEPNNKDLASEVAFSNDGRFAYVANRNTVSFDSDTLAIYAINPVRSDQHLTYLGQNKTDGKIPRHFSLSPDQKSSYVSVANEVTNDLELFARDSETGFLGNVVGNLSLGALDLNQTSGPMAVIWW